MEKVRNLSYKGWQRFFFSKETFLVYPTQKNRKTYNALDLLALSRVSELIRALPFYPPIHTQSQPPTPTHKNALNSHTNP